MSHERAECPVAFGNMSHPFISKLRDELAPDAVLSVDVKQGLHVFDVLQLLT